MTQYIIITVATTVLITVTEKQDSCKNTSAIIPRELGHFTCRLNSAKLGEQLIQAVSHCGMTRSKAIIYCTRANICPLNFVYICNDLDDRSGSPALHTEITPESDVEIGFVFCEFCSKVF